MRFLRYPEYKDSGVEWLGEVPSHWDILRLKHIADAFPSNIDKKSYEGEENVHLCNYVDVYYNEEIRADLPFMEATATREQVEKFTLRAGDTIITKDSETANDIAIASYVPEDLPGVVCGYHLTMVRPRTGSRGSFIKRLFDSCFLKNQFEVAARGLTRVGLSQYAIDNIQVVVPPAGEQAAIATFLDHETAKIDTLVTEQEKLIDLLKEKRQAVISHAVTKGLDPNFPMKDSGMEWLGEVPVHWEIVKISRHFSAHKGANAARLTKEYCAEIEGEYPVYSGQTENNGMMACINQYEFDSGAEGVILSTTVGAKSMSVSQISGKFSLSQNCMIIIPRQQDLSIRFFYYHFQPLFQYERDLIPNHMQPSFRMEDLYSYQIVLPPQEEQSAIAALLDREVAKIDDLVTESQHAIDLLKERRAALISAAVTGKIDVRHLHPQEMEDA